MKDIHAIRPPVQAGIDPEVLYFVFGGLLVVVLLVLIFFLIRKWLKKRKNTPQIKELPMPVPPYKEAVNSLKRLSGTINIDHRLFYFDLTMVLRKYIGDSFNTNAVEMTTQEFIKSLPKTDIDKQAVRQVIQFQKHCDPIKYAGILPDDQQVMHDLQFVESMVELIEGAK